jgi:hypothetical protein
VIRRRLKITMMKMILRQCKRRGENMAEEDTEEVEEKEVEGTEEREAPEDLEDPEEEPGEEVIKWKKERRYMKGRTARRSMGMKRENRNPRG